MNRDQSIEATFCFVDIAGYTALTESHGELAAADLIDAFTGLVRECTEPPGRVQELIGDCAFIVFPDPVSAVTAIAKLYALIADRQHFPVVRAGLHHGPALARDGRYFGSTVNVAARVAEAAVGGQVMVTDAVAARLDGFATPGAAIEHRGPIRLKNVAHPVDVHEIVMAASIRQFAIDPVCKMQVDRSRAAGRLHFEGEPYWFCSLSCAETFARDPAPHLPAPERAGTGRGESDRDTRRAVDARRGTSS